MEYIYTHGTGVSVLSISKANLNKYKFNLPSTKEQQKIADFLTLLDQKIEKQQQHLEQLKKQKKGLMQKMFI